MDSSSSGQKRRRTPSGIWALVCERRGMDYLRVRASNNRLPVFSDDLSVLSLNRKKPKLGLVELRSVFQGNPERPSSSDGTLRRACIKKMCKL